MRGWMFAVAALSSVLAFSSSAHAEEAAPRPRRYSAIDVQAAAHTQLLPRVSAGVDVAYAIGLRGFHARFGVLVLGTPPFELGIGSIANMLAVGQLDLCAAKEVLHHRIRVCVGGQGGVMAHRWRGFSDPGRDASPWVAGTIRADYRIELNRWFGVMFGANVTVPAVAPQFRGEEEYGALSPVIFPGPVAGALTLGASFDLSGRLAARRRPGSGSPS